jgi:hypothetical protein
MQSGFTVVQLLHFMPENKKRKWVVYGGGLLSMENNNVIKL